MIQPIFRQGRSIRSPVAAPRRSKARLGTPAPRRVLEWIRSCENPTGGIRVHSGQAHAYPEVTGYLVPTLLTYGEQDLATRLIRWLLCIQRADGAYTSPDGRPYPFDTGQVLRGLLAGAELAPGALEAAQRAADYLCEQMVDGGRGGFGERYAGSIPESVHLYVLPALFQAAEVLEKPAYRLAAIHCLEYYSHHKGALKTEHLTHFLGYALEALIDLGRAEVASPVLEALSQQQTADGAVPGRSGVRWVCTPGLAQLAICWYKMGQWEPADRAMAWLEKHQRPSGGFLGSYGPGAAYFPEVEPSWAAKFFLDAHWWQRHSRAQREGEAFPSSISPEDGRAQALLSIIQPHDRVLGLGSGQERFLAVVRAVYPHAECLGGDLSSAWRIPYPENSFEVVFSVEAMAHSPNPEAAVREMIRVARPGGWVVIMGKQPAPWGRLSGLPWERWPEIAEMRRLLHQGCDRVSVEPVSPEARPAAEGLMVVWRGQKRSPLSGSQWNEVLSAQVSPAAIVDRIRHNRLSEWAQAICLATAHGERVLEIGSGTGEISLHLAQGGRRVTALDFSHESLTLARQCAAELGAALETVQADATQPLPFADDAFDCTWSSGLLEHFSAAERRGMLREWRRVTVGRVMALVPNAACVAYRAGKAYREEQGIWSYGLETPLRSLRDDFEAAGLDVVSEYSVGARHALSFLPPDHPLRQALSSWIESLSDQELQDCHQGYLLVTIGSKRPGITD